MKKTYITPSTEIELAETTVMMAISFNVEEGNSGETADARAELDWNIWEEE